MTELAEVFKGDEINTGDDLGSEEPVLEPTGAVEDEAKAEAKTEQEKDDVPPTSKSADVPLAALLDEREKRQEAQRSNAALQERLNSQDKTPTDPFEDFEGAFNERADGLMNAVNSRFIDLTTDLARSRHDDYEEMENVFLEEAKVNPGLLGQMQASSNPAEFAYNHAKSKHELEEAGDLNALKAKIRAEVESELLDESNKDQSNRDSVPNSLSGARASGKSTGKAQSGPTPLDAIF